jgi:hypothetical protein
MALSPRIRTLRATVDLSGGAGTIREFPVAGINGSTPLYRAVNLRISWVSGTTASVPGTTWDLRTASGGLGVRLANGNIAVNNVGSNIASFAVSQAQSGAPPGGTGWLQSSPSLFFRITAAPAISLVVVIEIDVIDYGQAAAPVVSDNAIAGINNANTLAVQVTRAIIVGNFLYLLAPGLVTREGATKNNVAIYDLTTGLATAFNFTVAGGAVNDIAVDSSNGDVYLVGTFTSVNGTGRNLAACVDSTGTLKAWNPNVSGNRIGAGSTQVNRIIKVGTTLYFAGNFTTIGGGSTRNMAAAVDTGGSLTAWNPNLNGSALGGTAIGGLQEYAGTILIGGNITSVGGTARNCLAETDASSGLLLSWLPAVGTSLGGTVITDITTDGTDIWVAGTLTTAPARPGLAKFDSFGAVIAAFAPSGMSNPNPPSAAVVVNGYVVFSTTNNPSPPSRVLDKVTGANTGASLYQPGLRSGAIAVSQTLGLLFMGNLASASQLSLLRYQP